jgi:hypothetical protein
MIRIPYDQIAIDAAKYIENMALANDNDTIDYWQKMYTDLLDASGWDKVSFEQEELKRIDANWNDVKHIIRN